ncbi:MAG: VWA domain-containing protein [Verrucomicrobia bacterium]|nr:VWA domain-containing protein [Verrucomicrobiota bacterium]
MAWQRRYRLEAYATFGHVAWQRRYRLEAYATVAKDMTGNLQESENGVVRAVVEFCRFVRTNGVGSGTKETVGCVQALEAMRTFDPDTFRFTLRAVLCASKEEWLSFDKLFVAFWSKPENRSAVDARNSSARRFSAPRLGNEKISTMLSDFANSDLEAEGERKTAFGASAVERLRKIDFSQVPQADLAELERVSQRLLRRMSDRISRRLRPGKYRNAIDLRRTIRRSIGRGGELIELCYRGHRRQQSRLVILLDVSDSMNLYSFFLLKFAYVLGRAPREVETFIFSTSLVAVSSLLRTTRLSDALERLSQSTTGWSGGTKIGGSLEEFNRLYARRLLSGDTIFIILSDGWDTGAPDVLAAELSKIKRRVSRLIWLNPLLGLEEYEPVTRGMTAARPYIDVFAPAHNLESLLALERHLMS